MSYAVLLRCGPNLHRTVVLLACDTPGNVMIGGVLAPDERIEVDTGYVILSFRCCSRINAQCAREGWTKRHWLAMQGQVPRSGCRSCLGQRDVPVIEFLNELPTG